MPSQPDPLLDPIDERPRRRPLVVAAIGVLCLLAVGGGLFAFLRDDDDNRGAQTEITEVTFGPEGNATSIPQPPPHSGSVMQLSVDQGPAGSEVTLQGAGFRADDEVRKIELYWDRVGGQKLGEVDAPRFSTKITIPEDAPVLNEGHFIIAVQRDNDDKVVTEQSTQFYVVAPR